MHHFFSQERVDNHFVLSEEESRHCTKVMRLNVGDNIKVFDGNGGVFQCNISATGKRVEADIITVDIQEIKPKLELTLAVSPTKSADRMEWMVEKLVEIGVTKLVFLTTEKGERSRINLKRLEKKAVSALKQSGNTWLPTIETEVKFKNYVDSETAADKFVAHCFDKDKAQISNGLQSNSVAVMIGPEGDFSESEVLAANEKGFVPLSLGLPRFRTETAAVVAGTLFNHFNVTLAKR